LRLPSDVFFPLGLVEGRRGGGFDHDLVFFMELYFINPVSLEE